MRTVRDTYFENEPMDDLNKALFTFASYNAGPGRVSQLRREAEKRGLNPNVWFGNVEQIASERIGRETVTYVSNIFKYYIAYRLVEEENAAPGGSQGDGEGAVARQPAEGGKAVGDRPGENVWALRPSLVHRSRPSSSSVAWWTAPTARDGGIWGRRSGPYGGARQGQAGGPHWRHGAGPG